MQLARDIACSGRSDHLEVLSAGSPNSNPIVMRRLEGRPVIRYPEQLRLHRSLEELGWKGPMNEFNDAVRLKKQPVPEPILITTRGTILTGFGRWRLALVDGDREIPCI